MKTLLTGQPKRSFSLRLKTERTASFSSIWIFGDGKPEERANDTKLSMWCRNDLQNKAHWLGIQVSHVCAWGTSRLAFDGSGQVSRDPSNRALATFSAGKKYNADLSASYNIGVRYCTGELLKPCPAAVRSRILAKAPDAGRRTSCTLATLKKLSAVM